MKKSIIILSLILIALVIVTPAIGDSDKADIIDRFLRGPIGTSPTPEEMLKPHPPVPFIRGD